MKLVTTDVWQIDGADLRMAGGVRMPICSGLIRLADRTLLLYSPVKISDEDVGEINAEGEVRHIVAPNLFHHLYVKHAAERWPKATVHGPPGLAKKRSDLKIDHELGHASLDSTVDVEVIGGAPRINEALVFHRPSGTLLCADFLFNVTNPANWRTRFALSMMGVGGRELKQSRLWKLLAKDRDAVRASIDRVLGWPIGSILPAHGEPVPITSAALAPKLSRAYGGTATAALPA